MLSQHLSLLLEFIYYIIWSNLRLYCLYAFYTIATQISDFNYPIGQMCCPIMSVIFGKELYLIPQKMPLKRYGRFRAYHAYVRLRHYQTAISLITRLSAYGRTTLP